MTRTERMLYRRRHLLWIAAALLFLGGAIGVAFLWIQHEANRADQLADEADLRGTAVSTLATDVRQLRAQVKAEGKTPVAPDPTKAVEDLPDRAEVPVPIPGPKGDKGTPGNPGHDGSDGSDGKAGEPGQDGSAGTPGKDGAPGVDGQDGAPGEKGDKGDPGEKGEKGDPGERGPAGPTCPDGYSLQSPSYDPDALVCRRDGAPDPEPSSSPQAPAALTPDRRRF